jgi:hypothetical protein
MVDFGKMADDAKAKQDALAADDAGAATQQRAARAAAVDKAVRALADRVAPLMEKARQDFATRSVETKVVSDFDVKNFVSRKPSLKFSCLSPPRKSDQYRMESTIAVFTSDVESIFVHFEQGNSLSGSVVDKKELRQAPIEASEEMVTAAVGEVVAHYYEMIRTQGHHLK